MLECDSGPMIEASRERIGTLQREQLRKGLERKRTSLKQGLADIESSLKFLDSHPEFEEFHNLLAKSGF